TLPKLFFEDDIYKNLQALVEDLKRHPWKLFYRTKENKIKTEDKAKSAPAEDKTRSIPKTNIITR
ncbi:MAG: hypothetical protein NC914_02125, partial [Candidatus Omnitrophica bacterium]|nr:hypothetical protein [Candidatus Omnitrophota bacterium]